MYQFPDEVSTNVDDLDNTGIEWPSADAHLKPPAHSDITYIVTVAPNKPSEPKVKTSESPDPPALTSPVYAEQVNDQLLSFFPPRAPQRDPDKEVTMDEWDPMREDFESKSFNSYNSGPAAGLSGRQDTNMSRRPTDTWHRLHVSGLPREMSEEGLAKLAGQVCEVRNVKVISGDETKKFAFGFFNVPSNDIQKMMNKLNGYQLKGHELRINLAKPKENDSRGSSASDRSPRPTMMNNNSMQNRPVTPRTLENRYGNVASKSPSATNTGGGTNLQNGTHFSGDAMQQNSTGMVPMAVTRSMHNAKMQDRGASGGASAALPSRGRGQVLQSLSEKQSADPPVGKVSSRDDSRQQHVRFLAASDSDSVDTEYSDVIPYGEYVKMLNPSMQQGNQTETCSLQTKSLDNVQSGNGFAGMNNREQGKRQPGEQSLDTRNVQEQQKMQLGSKRSGPHTDMGGNVIGGTTGPEIAKGAQGKMQHGRGNDGAQTNMGRNVKHSTGGTGPGIAKGVQGKMQHGRGNGGAQLMDGNKRHGTGTTGPQNGRSAQRKMPRGRGNGGAQTNIGKRNPGSSNTQSNNRPKQGATGRQVLQVKRIEQRRNPMRMDRNKQGNRPAVMKDKPMKNEGKPGQCEKNKMQMKGEQPKSGQGGKETEETGEEVEIKTRPPPIVSKYILYDANNNPEIVSVIEECPEDETMPTHSPPRPYRNVPENYPNPRAYPHPPPGPPPGYGYGPYPSPPPPPWNAYCNYGYYPPPVDPWRARPPFHPDGFSPEYFHPGRRPPPWKVAQQNAMMMPLGRYRSRPYGSAHRFYAPPGPHFPPPPPFIPGEEGKSVEITEISRTPSPRPRPPDAIKQEEGDVIIETCDTLSESEQREAAGMPQDGNKLSQETEKQSDQVEVVDDRDGTAHDEDQSLQGSVEVDVEVELEADKMIQKWIETGQIGESDNELPEASVQEVDKNVSSKPSMGDEKNEPKNEAQETATLKTEKCETPKSPESVEKSVVEEPKPVPEAVEEQVNSTEQIATASEPDEARKKVTDEQDVKEKVADNVEGVPSQGAGRNMASKSPSPSKTSKRTPCANCGGLGSQKCSKCKTSYCSKECQAEHWSKHKLECKLIAEGKMPSSQPAQQVAPQQQQQQQHRAPPHPQSSVRAASPLFANKPAYVPHPQASAVHGRFLARDIPEAKPEEQTRDVLVTAVESPGCIYVNLIQATSCLPYVELTKLMKQTYPGLPTAKELHFYLTQVGELCAAEKKGEWRRAEILSINSPEQGVDVMLVDFGERIRVPRNNLKKLKEEMVKLPKQGVKCFLSGIHPTEGEERWSARARELLKARILKKECSVKFVGYDANRGHEITLFASSQSAVPVSEELISANLAAPINSSSQQASVPSAAPVSTPAVPSLTANIAEGSKLDIKLTYFVSIDLMYGHLAENVGQIQDLQMLLNTPGVVGETCHPDLPDCDQLVAALYTDGLWYRAKVNSITTPELCSVYFVDYGNRTEIAIKDCRLLPVQFAKIPYQAVGLVLAGVQRPAAGWNGEIDADEAFKVWIGEGDVECMVVRKHDDHMEVEMFNSKSPVPQMSFNSILADAGYTSAEQPATSPVQETTSKGLQSAPIEGFVAWVNDPSSFFIQNYADQEILTSLALGLHDYYTKQRSSRSYTPAAGSDCAALYDGAWCRGKVVECMGPISSKVVFVDFGNEAVIENDHICALAPQFKDIPAKAMECALDMVAPLDGQKEWSEQCILAMKGMIENKLCIINVARIVGDKRYVKAVLESQDVATALMKAGLVKASSQPPVAVEKPTSGQPGQAVASPRAQVSQPKPVPLIQVPEMELPSGEFPALVIWLNDPSEIFIQVAVKDNIEVFQQLSEGLHSLYEPLPQGTYQPQVGEVCVTKTQDGWLRSLVLAKQGAGSYKVQFIDFGNEEEIQGNIHKLDEALSKYPVVAGKCSLSGVCPVGGGQWSEQAKDWIAKEIQDQMVTVKKVDANRVIILKEDGSVAEKLIAAGHAKPATAVPEKKQAAPVMKRTVSLGTIKPPTGEFKGRLLHINNPTDMFIMVFNNEEVRSFQKLSNDISILCGKLGPSEGRVTTGDLCLAKCSDDAWYRARVIKSHSEDRVKVNFVDYGNDEEVKRSLLHPLPEQFAELPAMAIHCALAGVCPPGGGQTWNQEATAFVKKKLLVDEFVSAKVVKTTPTCYTMTMAVTQRNGPTLSVSQALIETSLAKDPSQQSPPKKEVRQPSSMGNQVKKMSPNQVPHASSQCQVLSPSAPVARKQSPPKGNQDKRPQGASPKQPQASPTSNTLKLCIPPPAPPGQEFEALVLNLNHPIDFYVITPENKQARATLSKDITAHYSSTSATDYRPETGDFVIATRKDMWGRAKVLKSPLPGGEAAALLFVDYGVKDEINFENIRPIEAQFAQLPAMALHCGIIDVFPPGGKGTRWEPETCKILREKICGCPCKVSVKSVSPKSGLHFVNLLVTMQKGKGKELHVREELLQYKLAAGPFKSNRDPSQVVSPPHASVTSPPGRSPDGNQPHSVKSPPGRSPDGEQMPSNKGAFQRYQKDQPSPNQQEHSQRNAKPSSSVTSPRAPVSHTPDVKPSGVSPPIPKAQIPTSKTFTGTVLWFNNPGSFFIQAQDFLQQAATLYQAIQKLPSDKQSGYKPNIGAAVLAEFDKELFRAVVIDMRGAKAKVVFVDYGNTEIVQVSAVRQMPDEIRAMPICAIHCCLPGVVPAGGGKNWSEEVMKTIRKKVHVSDQLCQVQIIDRTGDICKVSLTINSDNVRADLVKSGLVAEAPAPHHESQTGQRTPDLAIKFPQQDSATSRQVQAQTGQVHQVSRRSTTLPKLPLPTGQFKAVVVCVNHPGNFFIQLASEENAITLSKLEEDLNNFYSQPGRRNIKPKIGELCAAQFSQDKRWYRAQVVSVVSENTAKVLFLDFGNEEEVQCSIIKELSEEFHKVPVVALQCCLAGVQARGDEEGGQWHTKSPAATYMSRQVANGLCQIQVVDATTDPITVELLYNDQSNNPVKLSEDLIKKNLARSQTGAPTQSNQKMPTPKDTAARKPANLQIQPTQLPNGSFVGAISWANSPQDLYIQQVSPKLEILDEISTYYKGAFATLPQHQPVQGSVCAALFETTGDWCRAQALEYVSRDKIKVLFVDYGNTGDVDCKDVRKLEEKFIIDVPAFATACSLAGVTPVGNGWSKEATQLLVPHVVQVTQCDIQVTGCKEGIPGVMVEIKPKGDGSSLNQQLTSKGLAASMQNGAPSTPSPTSNVTLPSPQGNNMRSVSRASVGSGESDVEVIHARLSEKDRQIEEQKRLSDQLKKEMEQQKRAIEESLARQRQEMEEMKRQMEQMMVKANLPK